MKKTAKELEKKAGKKKRQNSKNRLTVKNEQAIIYLKKVLAKDTAKAERLHKSSQKVLDKIR